MTTIEQYCVNLMEKEYISNKCKYFVLLIHKYFDTNYMLSVYTKPKDFG